MARYVIPAWDLPALPVKGTEALFPVRRIHCVGRNYAEHAREMGGDPDREPPFFFSKPPDAIVPDGGDVPYPPQTQKLAYEMELVVAVGKGGANVARDAALDHVFGYAVGIDLTRRDLQAAAKEKGRPWEPGKAFDKSAPVSTIHPASEIGHPTSGRIWLQVNGEVRQQGDLSQMIWPVRDIIAYLSQLYALQPGDLIYTGTPAGVGMVKQGDELHGGVDGVERISVRIV
jgi:fumarylpyruvate hydrolase